MKKIFYLLFVWSVALGSCDDGSKQEIEKLKAENAKLVEIQNSKVAVPDNNFEQALIDLGYDDVIDGKVLTKNIDTITRLNLAFKNIKDLTGIEVFTALIWFQCSDNQLTRLDVSKNTALEILYCGYNQITSLDVSKNTGLTNLSCNSNQLKSLDVSNNTALTGLSCNSNQLTTLDLSNNLALTSMFCDGNQFDCDVLKAKYQILDLGDF